MIESNWEAISQCTGAVALMPKSLNLPTDCGEIDVLFHWEQHPCQTGWYLRFGAGSLPLQLTLSLHVEGLRPCEFSGGTGRETFVVASQGSWRTGP